MTDYKHTLNLPHTTFAMKANLARREPEMLQYWQDINLYEKLRQAGIQLVNHGEVGAHSSIS